MNTNRYRYLKRRIRVAPDDSKIMIDATEMKEIITLLDDYRLFVYHLLAYMSLNPRSKFENYYDVKAEATVLNERINNGKNNA